MKKLIPMMLVIGFFLTSATAQAHGEPMAGISVSIASYKPQTAVKQIHPYETYINDYSSMGVDSDLIKAVMSGETEL